jgi:hypothetical protein
MRSLDQMEPRLPLQAGVPGVTVRAGGELVISNSGSYYLTGNLTSTNPAFHCIEIAPSAKDVTLDLNGFTVSRTNGTGGFAGIAMGVSGVAGRADRRVVIRNGFIVGGGTNAGFAAAIDDISGVNMHVDNVHVSQVRNGIDLGASDTLRYSVYNSSVIASGDVGIVADVVTGCVVRDTKDTGITANFVSDSRVGQTNGSGYGILAETVMNSSGVSKDGVGIFATMVINSFARTSGPTDTPAISANMATSCVAGHLSGRAIQATMANGCLSIAGTNVITHKYNMP